jgi:hypothetical protein
MKVKCIDNKIYNQEKTYINITPGKEYIVLSIEFYNMNISTFSNFIGDYILYRIEDDDGLVKPIPSKLFKIVSNQLSKCWVSHRENDECFSILPSEWAKPSFWEDFYNDDYNTLEVFEKVRNQIYTDESCD